MKNNPFDRPRTSKGVVNIWLVVLVVVVVATGIGYFALKKSSTPTPEAQQSQNNTPADTIKKQPENKNPEVVSKTPSSNLKSFTTEIRDNLNNNEYQGKLVITLSQEAVLGHEKEVGVIGIPAFGPNDPFWDRNGIPPQDPLRRFIGPTYQITPQGLVLKEPVEVKLCYEPKFIGSLNEKEAKITIEKDYEAIEGTLIDVESHCASVTLNKFPESTFGLFAPISQ